MAFYRINYNQVISKVRILEDQADLLERQASALAQMEQKCRLCWKGEAAGAFLVRLESLHGEVSRTRTQVSVLASVIQSCADRIRQEDIEAQKRAAALSSGR